MVLATLIRSTLFPLQEEQFQMDFIAEILVKRIFMFLSFVAKSKKEFRGHGPISRTWPPSPRRLYQPLTDRVPAGAVGLSGSGERPRA